MIMPKSSLTPPQNTDDAQLFQTVLIANRGEIACRIIDTLRRMNIRSVAVYSDADANARHVRLADVAVRLGPAPAAQSYLNIEAVIAAARETGAAAIHPGYGFLSENPEFARACEAAGIVLIGPSAAAMEVMGDKISAKLAVTKRDVPTVPGIARPGLTDAELLAEAPSIGFPLLIKPSAGGGGKGMHVVTEASELSDAIAAARREAAASFGDDTLFIERYLTTPRHIEVQVLADEHGNVIHLGERECSLQRRHQKVIEEAPSPLLTDETRAAIGQAACETARSVNYRGAGTVEFIVDATRPDEFFFMEMNTRLQVEHPVTELVTGVDLVEQQVRIAAGQPLTLTQDEVVLYGHSIEARVYAEDPANGFLPTGGHVSYVRHPAGDGVRVDTAIFTGLEVSIDYDPMLAKVITWGVTREEARKRLVHALGETVVFGFATNIEFMRALLELPEVVTGELDTGLIARVQDRFTYAQCGERELIEASLVRDHSAHQTDSNSPWSRRDGWRLGPAAAKRAALIAPNELTVNGHQVAAHERVNLTLTGSVQATGDHQYTTTIHGHTRSITALVEGDTVTIAHNGAVFTIERWQPTHGGEEQGGGNPRLESPMPGTVVLVPAAEGEHVNVGDPVIVVEAMKMEHVLRATVAGTVSLRAALGEQVARGQTLAEILADNEA